MRRNANGALETIDDPEEQGELALKPGWPSMFRTYLNEPERYAKCFSDGWYLSGDLAKRDADGYYWFVGRSDDVIKTSGHLVGPFEVESVLMEHPAVAEAGVIGKPDPMAFEIIKAFISLKAGEEPSEQLKRDILAHARKRLGAVVAPKELDFTPNLPKTRSGKIMRRLLKARELGLARRGYLGAREELMTDHGDKVRLDRDHLLHLMREMMRIRRFEERCVELYSGTEDSRLPASLHRRRGECGRRHAGAQSQGRRDHDLSGARPCARARHRGKALDGRDVRQDRRHKPRSRRLDARVRQGDPILWRERDRRRRPAARRGHCARGQDARRAQRHGMLLRRWRDRRRRVPRKPQPCGACGSSP